MDEITALRAAVPPLGEPVGILEHAGRSEHPERFCPYCYAVGDAPCMASRPVSLEGSGLVVVPRATALPWAAPGAPRCQSWASDGDACGLAPDHAPPCRSPQGPEAP